MSPHAKAIEAAARVLAVADCRQSHDWAAYRHHARAAVVAFLRRCELTEALHVASHWDFRDAAAAEWDRLRDALIRELEADRG